MNDKYKFATWAKRFHLVVLSLDSQDRYDYTDPERVIESAINDGASKNYVHYHTKFFSKDHTVWLFFRKGLKVTRV